jgi:RHS repeat-associated protein
VLEYDYGSGGSADDKLSRISALKINGEGSNLAQYTYLGAGSVVTAHYPEPDYTWNLATGSGATRYAGLDTFDRTLTCLWQGDVSGTPDDMVHLAYEYDRVSNRISREDLVSKNLGTAVYRDEAYTYDGLDRLVDVQRGELSGGSITGLNFQQNWQDPSTSATALDPTGNWTDFRQDTTGNTTFDVVQTRTHNEENEITDIDATSGGSWVDPLYDAVGNTTRIPRVLGPSSNYLLTYDAWNRVVKIESDSSGLTSIGAYSYDGLHRRVTRDRYVSNEIDFSRRMYYTDNWQVLEERQEDDSEWLLNKQYVWGIRYIDELVLRDQDTSSPINGTLNIRHYALQDANFNVVALINTNGSVGRRYEYDAYGHSITLEADYSLGAYEYDFEYRYAGYRWDYETYLLQVRNRWYHPSLGRWLSRDPIGYEGGDFNLCAYTEGRPTIAVDPFGLEKVCRPRLLDLKGDKLNNTYVLETVGGKPEDRAWGSWYWGHIYSDASLVASAIKWNCGINISSRSTGVVNKTLYTLHVATIYSGTAEAATDCEVGCAKEENGNCRAFVNCNERIPSSSVSGIWYAATSYQITYNGPIASIKWSATAVYSYEGATLTLTAALGGNKGGLSGGAEVTIGPGAWTQTARLAATSSWLCECKVELSKFID